MVLTFLFNIPETTFVQIVIIAVVSVIFIWTAVSGVEKGIKVLGDINLYLAIALLGLTIVIGPTIKIINSFTNGVGGYLTNFIQDSLHIEAFGDNSWINSWTIFYWAWWIAWAPFVGTFIARISRGRTIREFIFGVVLAPAVASFVWFAAFGGLGLNLFESLGIEGLTAAAASPETALFIVLKHYNLGYIISLTAVLLLCTFFITSANSATFVLGMLSSEGNLDPTNGRKILWGVLQSLLATSLLLAGGLEALQTISVAAAFPFIFVMLFAIVSIFKALKSENI